MFENVKIFGTGCGYGDGYGYGYGDGSGYGYGYGYGSGYGYGYGDGYGSGYGYGYGSGYGYGKIYFCKQAAFLAFHFINKKDENIYVLRTGKFVYKNEELCELDIKLCERGLHSSLSIEDAKKYRPQNSVLTKVLVWGDVIFDRDKLVSTHRQIIEDITGVPEILDV